MATGYQLTSVLSAGDLNFAKLVGSEALGEPFRYEIHLLSKLLHVEFDSLLGQPLTLQMSGESGSRYFNGIVTQISHHGRAHAYEHYVAIVRPQLWVLKQSFDCRIFQNQRVPDIIKQVLQEGAVAINDQLTEEYAEVAYCVQYRESNFDFVSRLMEQEGIYYYFLHSDSGHEMVLVDSSSAHGPIEGLSDIPYQAAGAGARESDHLWEFRPAGAVTSGTVVLTDYDFEKPRAALEVRTRQLGSYDLQQGEVYDYPGKYIETDVGANYSRSRLEGLQTGQRLCYGEGNATGLAAGGLFTLHAFPREDDNIEYLIVRNDLEIEAIELSLGINADPDELFKQAFRIRFDAIPSTIAFRSPRRTPRPVVGGPHTAVVVGKEGEEIWTDEYGRIKVQFHWDRLGSKDENSTCWLRVAQGWAGAQWGSIFIPRIGQEVMVQFLEGDPDRPLVTGSLYNADQMPPYELPANMTQSGIKTRSTKDGTDENFNELRFEDKKDEEEIYLHAERDFTRVVENNDTLRVGFDKQDAGDQTIDIFNDRTVTLEEGNDKLQVKLGDRTVLIDQGDSTLTIDAGNRTEEIEGDDALTIRSGNHSIKIEAGKSLIEAAQEIQLKVGNSSIKITPQGISLSAAKIEITGNNQVSVNSDMAVSIDGGLQFDGKGTMTTLDAEGVMTITGGIVKIN